ncbi:MAG: ParA family protein [Spirochaetales bacterium]|nr:ParA family protein [Spirochaetales bacterium]
MGRTIAIGNRKGGSGKTTTSVNLAAALAHKGRKVLLVDADAQGHSALSLGSTVTPGQKTLFDVLVNGVEPEETVRSTYLSTFHLIPGGSRLATYERDHATDPSARLRLAERLDSMRERYDYVLIDTPPTLGLMTICSLIASTDVLVPMQAHFLAMEGLAETIRVLGGIEKYYHSAVRLLGVIPTFYQANARLSRAIIGQIRDRLGESAVLHPIRTNIALAEAPSHGMTIFQYQPRSNGAYDYLHLANQVENLS